MEADMLARMTAVANDDTRYSRVALARGVAIVAGLAGIAAVTLRV
jgi:hypothetical protein